MMPPKRKPKSGVRALSSEELRAIAPEAFAPEDEVQIQFTASAPMIPFPVTPEVAAEEAFKAMGPRPIYQSIVGPKGTMIDAPVFYEGETFKGFMTRSGMTVSEAHDFLHSLTLHPKNPRETILVMLAEAIQEAVSPGQNPYDEELNGL